MALGHTQIPQVVSASRVHVQPFGEACYVVWQGGSFVKKDEPQGSQFSVGRYLAIVLTMGLSPTPGAAWLHGLGGGSTSSQTSASAQRAIWLAGFFLVSIIWSP